MRSILQLCVVASLALGAGACQTIADLDPTGLLSDSSPAPASQFPAGEAPQTSDATVGTTPDLASIPAAPATAAAAQQQQTVQSINADGAQARYSADTLRGGTEAAAPAPGAAEPTTLPQVASNTPPPAALPSVMDAPPTTNNPATDAPPTAGSPAAAVPAAGNRPVQTAALPPTGQAPTPASSAPAASVPPGAEPAVPANTPVRGVPSGMSGGVASDASLGFQPSQAPALDASINQWVPAAIVAHYRQTASNPGVRNSSAAVPQKGGPVASDGSVVANMGAIPMGPASVAAVNGGDAPTAVVFFPGDGTTLAAAARTQIRAAVQAFKSGGGAGTIRVIGHASSRTANMPVEKHLELIFNKSQARANAVAQELIHQGIPADKVLVEAVGDSQPVYYESMPKGEDGNRRADIYVQS